MPQNLSKTKFSFIKINCWFYIIIIIFKHHWSRSIVSLQIFYFLLTHTNAHINIMAFRSLFFLSYLHYTVLRLSLSLSFLLLSSQSLLSFSILYIYIYTLLLSHSKSRLFLSMKYTDEFVLVICIVETRM